MILHKDIIQQTPEWFEIKWGKIGGFRSGGLLVSSDNLLMRVLSEVCEDFALDDSFESSAMQRGNELEPVAIRDLSKYTGVNYEDIGWIEHSTIKLLGISPDGLSSDLKSACEVKCPSAKKHIEYIKNKEIPLEYIYQCIHYFTVIDTLETLDFGSFRPENKYQPLFAKRITRDSEVNIGTKAKPVIKTVAECVTLSEKAALQMEIDLLIELENIKF